MESPSPPRPSLPLRPSSPPRRAPLFLLPLLATLLCLPSPASPSKPQPQPPTPPPTPSPAPAPSSNPSPSTQAPAAPAAPAAALYQRACQSCHGPEGKGQPGLYPPLADSDWVNAPSPARLIRLTLHGVAGPLAINGKPFPTAVPFMPGHAATLNDNEIATLLTWLRRSMGNHAPAVSPDQVQAVRTAEATRTALWTTAELLKIPEK